MWLPSYMKNVLHFNMNKSEYYVFLPYLILFFTQIICGKLADFVIENKFASVLTVRKISQTFGALFPGIFLALLCIHPPIYACIILMALSVGVSGCGIAGSATNLLDLAPQYAGELYGLHKWKAQ